MNNGPAVYGAVARRDRPRRHRRFGRAERLKAELGPDRLAVWDRSAARWRSSLFAFAREPVIALLASLIAGASWIVDLACLFVSAQVALPDWVRGRGLAIFLTVHFGAMTFASAVWGQVASLRGALHRASRRRRRCAARHSPDLALEAAGRRRARSGAVDALAHAARRLQGRPVGDRLWSPSDIASTRRIAARSSARSTRWARAQARRRLRLGRVRGRRGKGRYTETFLIESWLELSTSTSASPTPTACWKRKFASCSPNRRRSRF